MNASAFASRVPESNDGDDVYNRRRIKRLAASASQGRVPSVFAGGIWQSQGWDELMPEEQELDCGTDLPEDACFASEDSLPDGNEQTSSPMLVNALVIDCHESLPPARRCRSHFTRSAASCLTHLHYTASRPPFPHNLNLCAQASTGSC